MKKKILIFLTVVILTLGLGGSYIHAVGRHHMTAEVKGEINGVLSNQTCVNETVILIIRDLNTGNLLDKVYVKSYYNREIMVDLVTNSSGTVQFTPKKEGEYKISMEKSRYVSERINLYVPVCTVTSTTTSTTSTSTTTSTSITSSTTSTTTTSTTTTSTTTTSPTTTITTTTTSTTSTTLPKETCGDGIQNQGEEGIDCGGPCNPCPSENMQWLVLVVVVIAGGIIVFMMGSSKKEGKLETKKIGGTGAKELTGVDQEVNKVKKKKHHKKSEVEQDDMKKGEKGMAGGEPREKKKEAKKEEDDEKVKKTRKKKTKAKKKGEDKKVKKTRKKKTKAKKRKTNAVGEEGKEETEMKSKREDEKEE